MDNSERLARAEVNIQHIQADVSEMKPELSEVVDFVRSVKAVGKVTGAILALIPISGVVSWLWTHFRS